MMKRGFRIVSKLLLLGTLGAYSLCFTAFADGVPRILPGCIALNRGDRYDVILDQGAPDDTKVEYSTGDTDFKVVNLTDGLGSIPESTDITLRVSLPAIGDELANTSSVYTSAFDVSGPSGYKPMSTEVRVSFTPKEALDDLMYGCIFQGDKLSERDITWQSIEDPSLGKYNFVTTMNGEYCVGVANKDKIGFAIPYEVEFFDEDLPVIEVDASSLPSTKLTPGTKVVLNFTVSDVTSGITKVQGQVGNGSWETLTEPYKLVFTDNASFSINAFDGAGNKGNFGSRINVYEDPSSGGDGGLDIVDPDNPPISSGGSSSGSSSGSSDNPTASEDPNNGSSSGGSGGTSSGNGTSSDESNSGHNSSNPNKGEGPNNTGGQGTGNPNQSISSSSQTGNGVGNNSSSGSSQSGNQVGNHSSNNSSSAASDNDRVNSGYHQEVVTPDDKTNSSSNKSSIFDKFWASKPKSTTTQKPTSSSATEGKNYLPDGREAPEGYVYITRPDGRKASSEEVQAELDQIIADLRSQYGAEEAEKMIEDLSIDESTTLVKRAEIKDFGLSPGKKAAVIIGVTILLVAGAVGIGVFVFKRQ